MVNKSKINGKNTFNGNAFGTEGNHGPSKKKLYFEHFYSKSVQ